MGFNSVPGYNEKYSKTKTKSWEEKTNINFY